MVDKEKAKAIIVEIVRQAGGSLDNKTNLFKAFYHAHLQFAETNAGYLSCWPIVRMPRGPGIDKAGTLLSELVEEGMIVVTPVLRGNTIGSRFTITDKQGSGLNANEIIAIQFGVAQVVNRSAAKVSQESHDKSRSWREGHNGQELNIYTDRLSEDEYQKQAADIRETAEILRKEFSF